MKEIWETECYRQLQRKCRGCEETVRKFSRASTRAEFEMLCDLHGFRGDFHAPVFVLVLADMLKCSSAQQGKALAFLEFASDLGRVGSALDDAFGSNAFVSICGRWLGKNYMRKDKCVFWSLMTLMGIAADRRKHR